MTAPPVNLEELERLYEAATPGPWHYRPREEKHGGAWIADHPEVGRHTKVIVVSGACYSGSNDYRLIAAAVTELPTLLTLARQAQAAQEENERLRAEIERLRMENTHLRITAQKVGCTYGHLKDGGCELGYPGCACMDDILAMQCWSPEDEEKATVRLGRQLTRLQSLVDEAAGVLEPNSVYLAARYSRHPEMRKVRTELERLGFVVTSRWINGGHELTKEGSTEAHETERVRYALEDSEDLSRAELVISFTEEPRKTTTRGGRHVEFGMGLATGKRQIVVGWRENVFHCLPQVEFFPSWPAAVSFLSRLRAQPNTTKPAMDREPEGEG